MSFHLFSVRVPNNGNTYTKRETEKDKHTFITLNELEINDSHRFRCCLPFVLSCVQCFYLSEQSNLRFILCGQSVKSENLTLDFNFTECGGKTESMGHCSLLATTLHRCYFLCYLVFLTFPASSDSAIVDEDVSQCM